MNSEAFKLANSLSASGAAWPRQISANRAIFSWRISCFSHFNIYKIRLFFLLKTLFLNNFSQIQIPFQLALFLDSLDNTLLVFKFPCFTIFFEYIMIIKLGHFIWILKEIILQVHEFVLCDCFSLIGINFPSWVESIGSVAMASSDCSAHFVINC